MHYGSYKIQDLTRWGLLIGGYDLMLVPEISLLDHLPGYIGWKDLNRHYLGANKALLEFKGFSDVEEVAGKTALNQAAIIKSL